MRITISIFTWHVFFSFIDRRNTLYLAELNTSFFRFFDKSVRFITTLDTVTVNPWYSPWGRGTYHFLCTPTPHPRNFQPRHFLVRARTVLLPEGPQKRLTWVCSLCYTPTDAWQLMMFSQKSDGFYPSGPHQFSRWRNVRCRLSSYANWYAISSVRQDK